MPILSALWPILSSYRPSAASDRQRARRFGAFVPTYYPPAVWRGPKDDREAQKLYNHVRTVAFYMDAAPVLADAGLPFRAGLDDIISLVPLYGDIVSGVLQLYQVWLCWLFGVPLNVCIQMFFNVLLDTLVGIVPIIGDILDNLFKANLRNLALLETYLLSNAHATATFHILLMPDSDTFLPEPRTPKPTATSGAAPRWSAWFGFGSGNETAREEARNELERERMYGEVRKTRRMNCDEAGFAFGRGHHHKDASPPSPGASPSGGAGVYAAQMQGEAEAEAEARRRATRPNGSGGYATATPVNTAAGAGAGGPPPRVHRQLDCLHSSSSEVGTPVGQETEQ